MNHTSASSSPSPCVSFPGFLFLFIAHGSIVFLELVRSQPSLGRFERCCFALFYLLCVFFFLALFLVVLIAAAVGVFIVFHCDVVIFI